MSKHKWLAMQLMMLALVIGGFLLVRPHLARALNVNPNLVGTPMEGSGIGGDPYLITTCEQLQDIDGSGLSYRDYALANDIDCSATASWNSGAGFIPIGSNSHFTGSFDGHGYTISNITVNSTDDQGHTGIFAQTNQAVLGNFSVVNASITGNGQDDEGNAGTGGIIGLAQKTNINRVSFEGNITHTNCSLQPNVGGIIGRASSESTDNSLTMASSKGTITVNGSNCGDYTAGVGGLVGVSQSFNEKGLQIYNAYSTMDLVLNGDQQLPCTNGHCRSVGGLIGAQRGYDMATKIVSAYSAGSITINDSDTQLEYRVGGIVGSQFAPFEVSSVFEAMAFNLPNTCDIDTCATTQRYNGALIGASGTWNENIVNNFWYDADLAPNDSCANNTADAACHAYNVGGSEPDFMKNNTSAGTLGGFDFTNVWQVVTNDYPILQDNQPAYPHVLTNLWTTVLSQTSIQVNWTPLNSPSEIFDQHVLCKRSDSATWSFCQGNIANTATSAEITGLAPGTSYDFRVVVRGADSAYSNNASPVVTGTTATPGFTLISDCQELQNMQDDLEGFYELGQNIDCADTITWNGGTGFDPIAHVDFADLGSSQIFTGILKGNNYTISNLYSDQTTNSLMVCGLFGNIYGEGIIQDLKLDNLTCSSNIMTGGLSAIISGSNRITNVHITNSHLGGPSAIAIGGLTGALNNTQGGGNQTFISTSSFQGTLDAYNPMYIGGFAGLGAGIIHLNDNYSNATITAEAVSSAGGFIGGFGIFDSSTVQHNYATGSINITSSDPDLNQAEQFGIIPDTYSMLGGFMGFDYNPQTADVTMTKNFTNMSLTSQSPENQPGGFAAIIIYDGTYTMPFDNYFDADLAGVGTCQAATSPFPVSCTGISGQPNYFKNNNTNAPLDTWDFDNIWMTTSELPVFGTKVTTGITTIDPERLNPPATVNPPATGGTATTEGVDNPVAADLISSGNGVTANSTSAPADETGVLGAIKHFVRNLPVAVVVAFPYALFGLLLIATLLLAVELIRELRRLHIIELLIKKQRSLAEERDAFWHLAANYLRAPVTLIVGGAEALHESHDGSTPALISLAAAELQEKVAEIMKKIEGSVSLQSIKPMPAGVRTGVAHRKAFYIPLMVIALLVGLANYAAASWRDINPGILGYASQAAIFVIAALVFYWVLSLLTSSKGRRKAAEQLLEHQTTELNTARHELINDTATSLNPSLTKLEGLIKDLPASSATTAPGALATLHEGADRLRQIVTSFAMLIKVQEASGQVNATTGKSDLTSILNNVRSKLTPQISAKGVRVTAPALPLSVSAESDMAQQVIESIVSNAVDYSPNNGTVKVEAQQLDGAIQLRVSDQGQGIDKDQLSHLFQPFVRADGTSAMDMSHGGFGINLYLDKLIMEQLGGSISATSTPGKGTAITLTWPS